MSLNVATAWICGLADASVWIAYMLSFNSMNYHIWALSLKVAAIIINLRNILAPKPLRLVFFVLPMVFVSIAHFLISSYEEGGLLLVSAFSVSLLCTLIIVDENVVLDYFKAASASLAAGGAAFLLFVFTGRVEEEWGRWLYFSTHPNVGGEILYTGVLCTALSFARFPVVHLSAFAVFLYGIMLVQARAALLASVSVVFYLLYRQYLKHISLSIQILIFGFIAVGVVSVGLFDTHVRDALSAALFLDDEYRGVGTGFVGRDDRWTIALEVFSEHPFLGIGFGFFREEGHGEETPHNFWLYLLSEMGLMGIPVFATLAVSAANLWSTNRSLFFMLSSSLILTVFNDRFINLNPYPFIVFVILFFRKSIWRRL